MDHRGLPLHTCEHMCGEVTIAHSLTHTEWRFLLSHCELYTVKPVRVVPSGALITCGISAVLRPYLSIFVRGWQGGRVDTSQCGTSELDKNVLTHNDWVPLIASPGTPSSATRVLMRAGPRRWRNRRGAEVMDGSGMGIMQTKISGLEQASVCVCVSICFVFVCGQDKCHLTFLKGLCGLKYCGLWTQPCFSFIKHCHTSRTRSTGQGIIWQILALATQSYPYQWD